MCPTLSELEQALARSQPGSEEQVALFNALARELAFSDPLRAIELAEKARDLSADNDKQKAESLYNLARANIQIGNYADSLAYLLDAQPLYEQLDDKSGLMWLYNELGRIYYFLSDYPVALEYYLKVQTLAHELGNSNRQAAVAHNIGLIYYSTGDIAQAEKTMIDGLEIALKAKDEWVQGFLFSGLAEIYYHSKNYPKALEYGSRGLEMARARGHSSLITGALIALAWTCFDSGEPQKAADYLSEAARTAKKSEDRRGTGEVLRAQAEQAVRQGRALEAIQLLAAALAIAEELGEKAFIANCHHSLSDAYKSQNELLLALQSFERYHDLDKEIFNEKSDLKTKSLAVIHQLEKARHEAEIYQLRSVLLQQEIDERIKAQDALEYLANHDPLTGLLNRRAFFLLGKLAFDHTQSTGAPLSVVEMDIDHFKRINDTFGHQVGDQVLKEFSELIGNKLRQAELISRYGGEEFAILLVGLLSEDVEKIASRLLDAIRSHQFQTGKERTRMTVSIGIAHTDISHPQNLDELMNQADRALYLSKNSGRNCINLYSSNRF